LLLFSNSCFKIPIPINESSTCNIAKGDHMHDVLKDTKLIIWDEAPMQHHYGPIRQFVTSSMILMIPSKMINSLEE
jgi:hypothetical protein